MAEQHFSSQEDFGSPLKSFVTVATNIRNESIRDQSKGLTAGLAHVIVTASFLTRWRACDSFGDCTAGRLL